MKINYDKKVDALNISLRSGVVYKTVEVAPEVMLDVDKKGNTLSIEILGASEKIGKKNFSKLEFGGKFLKLPALA